MGVLLVLMFIVFVAIGVPISFTLGIVSFTGICALPNIPPDVVFTKLFNGLNSFTLLAVPLFILAANLMNAGSITDKLIDTCTYTVGRFRGGLAYANILVSMIFAGISGSSQADTAGIGKVLIPAMEKEGYDKETSVGVTAISSTIGSIIPPSIIMVVYAGVANKSPSQLFMSGLLPGILVGFAQMAVVKFYSKRKNFPVSEKVPFKKVMKQILTSLPALFTPVLLIGGIVTGFFTATESAAFASVYALLIALFFYHSFKMSQLPAILMDTMKLSALSLFALATANALGELLSYYHLNEVVAHFFTTLPGGKIAFLFVVIAFFLFVGMFMDAVPAIILFCPVIIPAAQAMHVDLIILGLIVVITLAYGLVTPPYGLCLLIACSISNITIERGFKGTAPYFFASMIVLLLLALFPDFWLSLTTFLFPTLFG